MPIRLLILSLLLFSSLVRAAGPDLLEPGQAFRFSAEARDAATIAAHYRIADGYYMYRDKFQFSAQPVGVKLGLPQFPPAITKQDRFFGRVEIYRGDVTILLPVAADGVPRAVLAARSQGCADAGVCYVPQEQTAHLELVAAATTPAPPGSGTARGVAGPPDFIVSSAALSNPSQIAGLFGAGFWILVLSFFGFGLLLAFTPCVFPMIPILSGIIAGQGASLTKLRGLGLAAAYVIGMAVTYAAAGVAAGLSGAMLSAALQNAWVLGAFAAIFVLLALSMFGFYELQLPVSWQSRLSASANRLRGGHVLAVFAMGALSAVIVGPCVAAPLAGALLYIGQTRDVVLGGSALFAMALGMGVPLLVVGVSAGALLPRAGPWMESVKRFFGVLLLGVAIYLISPVVPAVVNMLLWAALLILSAIYLHAVDALSAEASSYRRLCKGVGVIALVTGVALVIGVLAGGRDVLQPLAGLRSAATPAVFRPDFRPVNRAAQPDAADRIPKVVEKVLS